MMFEVAILIMFAACILWLMRLVYEELRWRADDDTDNR